MNRQKSKGGAIKAVLIFLAVVALMFGIYKGGRWLESQGANPDTRGDHKQRLQYDTLLEQEGKTYRLRKDITAVLIAGIDSESSEIESGGARSGGQADFQRLIVLDRGAKKLYQFEIDRDTMADITILDVMGEPSGTRKAQICLAYSFGDGKEDSCELACEAVSKLFFGLPIDFYCAVNMDGIGEINDFVGGITVTLEDDFSSLDPAMKKGETLTLNAQQAEHYVRSRMSVGVGTNEARMLRQHDYIEKLIKRLDVLQQADPNFAEQFYDELQPFMTTNIPKGRIINEISAAEGYERPEPISLKGRHEIAADGHMQFFHEEDSLRDTVLELFFQEIK